MRLVLVALVLALLGCRPDNRLADASMPRPEDAAIDTPPDACFGIGCQVAQCERLGRPKTTVSGTVYAPNGELPLYGVTVYVPSEDPGPLTDGVQCSKCGQEPPGRPVALAVTNELGRFTLENVPSGTDIPLVVTIGKWRRRLVLPAVTECTDNPVAPALTRLPKNKTEGDIPKIAMVTGGCDALECLIRKLGIEDSEFSNDTNNGRIHMFTASGGASSHTNSQIFAPVTTLWGDRNKLMQYDITVNSCECGEHPENKPQASMDNMKAYADAGGRLFLSHFHYIWIVGNGPTQTPAVWPAVASCNSSGIMSGNAIIDTVNNKKGQSLSLWMQYVMGSPFPGVIPITDGKQSCTSVDPMKGERWVYLPVGGTEYPQMFQFTTPNEVPSNSRCGKVVFSDMHVSSDSDSRTPFPSGCSASPMTSQEKALAFMFFDIASCVGIIQ